MFPVTGTIWALAALGTGGAYWAGRHAADSLTGVAPRVQPHIAEHSDWAWWTLWVVVLLAVARLALTLWETNREGKARRAPLRWLVWLGSVGCVALVFYTADLGGGLVYQHQVAVGSIQEPGARDGRLGEGATTRTTGGSSHDGSPRDRWIETEDGIRVWRPSAQDTAALGTLLVPAEGSSLEAVTTEAGPTTKGTNDGLRFRIQGRAVLVLPGEYADVQVEVDLDMSGFEGVVGVVHRVANSSSFGAFTVSPSGEAVLADVEAGERQVLDSSSMEPLPVPATLAVSAVGTHLKGLVDGEQVTHGHTGEDAAGGAGLLLDGRGSVRILEMRLIPLD